MLEIEITIEITHYNSERNNIFQDCHTSEKKYKKIMVGLKLEYTTVYESYLRGRLITT